MFIIWGSQLWETCDHTYTWPAHVSPGHSLFIAFIASTGVKYLHNKAIPDDGSK